MLERMQSLLLSEDPGDVYDTFYYNFRFSVENTFGLFVDGANDEANAGNAKTAAEYRSGNVDPAYNAWVQKYSDNAAVFSAIATYLDTKINDGSFSTTEEMSSAKDLQTLLENAKKLKEEIDGLKNATEHIEKNQAITRIETHLIALNGTAQKPGLDDTLRKFNDLTGRRFVKDSEFKALNLLNSQLDKTLAEMDRCTFDQINTSITNRDKEQADCEQKVTEYNQKVVEYFKEFSDVNGDSREKKVETIEKALKETNNAIAACEKNEKIYGQKVKTLPAQIKKENALLTNMKKELKELKNSNSDVQEKLDDAKASYQKRVDELTALKQRLEKEQSELLLKQVRSKMDQATDDQKRLLSRVEGNYRLIDQYNEKIAAVDKELAEFDKKIDFEKYGDDPDKKNPNYSSQDEARAKELKNAKKALFKLGGNDRYLDGMEIYNREEIDALIESLRINSDSDIEKLQKDNTPHTEKLSKYLEILREYADHYDTRHKGEKKVSVSGKDFFSVSRKCTVGIKAAIDLLNGLLPEDDNAPVEQPLAVGLRDGINKLTMDIENAMKFNMPLYRALQLEDKKEQFAKKSADTVNRYKVQIIDCKSDIKEAVKRIEELSVTVNDERTKDEATKEQEMKTAQDAKITKTQEDIKKAELAVENADERVKSRQRAIDPKVTEKCKRLEREIEEKTAVIVSLNKDLKSAKEKNKKAVADKEEYLSFKKKMETCQGEEKEKFESIDNLKKTCVGQLEKLDAKKPSLAQQDHRVSNITKKVNSFWEDVEKGNFLKKDGSWDHKNGKHYTDLKNELETFKNNLANGRMSLTEVASSLESLEKKAQSYLDTRGSDWSKVFSSGSHFRHARIAYVTNIRNYCRLMSPYCKDTLTALNAPKEAKLTAEKADLLCPGISTKNIQQITHNLKYDANPELIADTSNVPAEQKNNGPVEPVNENGVPNNNMGENIPLPDSQNTVLDI